jgi:hypothetical protein
MSAFFAYVQTQFQQPILALQTDNGREFVNSAVHSLLSTHGAVIRFSCPYTSQQNGKAERVLHTLNEGVHALLFHASMPGKFWAEALYTSTFLLNRRPCRSTAPHIPHALLLLLTTAYCASSGVSATPTRKPRHATNSIVALSHASSSATHPDHHGYRCYDPVSRRVLTSRHVHFVEDVFPFAARLLCWWQQP